MTTNDINRLRELHRHLGDLLAEPRFDLESWQVQLLLVANKIHATAHGDIDIPTDSSEE